MTPAPLAEAVRALAPGAQILARADLADLPAFPGAYALAISCAAPLADARFDLPAGWHVYAGSAYGPGGVRARLGRHFDPEKSMRWHVDRLTVGAAELAAVAIPGGRECDVVARLLATGGFHVLAPGFGSSDCRRCAAHLLTWRGG